MSELTKPDAEEFSQSLEQIGEGWFRQLALGIKLRVPEALGLSRREWCDRIGLKIRNRAERQQIGFELAAEGLSNRAIADAMGVDEGTVRNDRRAAENSAATTDGQEDSSDASAENSAPEQKTPFVIHNTGNPSWYAAVHLIKAAKAVMVAIDLDVASCAIANEVVGAAKFYSKEDDGLALPWRGRIWLNPPYSTGLVEKFAMRLLESFAAGETTEACCLFNNSTDAKWFQLLGQTASAVCFPAGRKNYWHPDGTVFQATSPLQGQSIIYFGDNRRKFAAEFSNIGLVMSPCEPAP